ncbi:MAG: DUF4202 domain-containing protein [Chloroflexi bacterium]|nr:MAG: DUF4202 domain-containing protein [Chloroflexota bacterium]
MTLEEQAEAWVMPFENGRHLVRTRDWLVELDPGAGEALRIAALTHDVERNFPGGPRQPANVPANDRAYRDAHQARSAELVTTWLLAHRANPALIREVAGLVRVHEWGGSPAADLLQAADSISFLETTALHAGNWIREGRYTRERTEEQLKWMLDRIRVPEARRLAQPFFDAAFAELSSDEAGDLSGR